MSCINCPQDTYGDADCPHVCLPCPSHSSTRGKVNQIGVESCICRKGYYLESATISCLRCPYPPWNFYCPDVSNCVNDPTLANGGWFAPANSRIAYRCLLEEACLPPISNCASTCAEGYRGTLCSECDSHFYSQDFSYKCKACPNLPIFYAMGVGLVYIIAVVLLFLILLPPIERSLCLKIVKAKKRLHVIPKLRILTFFLSSFFLLGSFDLDLRFINNTSSDSLSPLLPFFHAVYVLSRNIAYPIKFSFFECLGSLESTHIITVDLQIAALLPLCLWISVTVILYVIFTIARARYTMRTTEPRGFKGSKAYWISFLGLRPLAEVGHVLIEAPFIATTSGTRSSLLSIAIPSLIIISLGVPISLVVLGYIINRKSIGKHFVRTALSMGIYEDGFTPRFKRLSLCALRQLLMNFLIVFSYNTAGNAFYAGVKAMSFVLVFFLLIMIHIVYMPYEGLTLLELQPDAGKDNRRHYFSNINTNSLGLIALFVNWISFLWIALSLCIKELTFSIICLVCIILLNIGCLLFLIYQLYLDLNLRHTYFQWKNIVLSIVSQDSNRASLLQNPPVGTTLKQEAEESLNFGIFAALTIMAGEYEAGLTNRELLPYFTFLIRTSPVPPEAVAQLLVTIKHPRFEDTTPADMTQYLIEKGHIEPQTTVQVWGLPTLKDIYKDVTRKISTRNEFIEEITDILYYISEQLKISEKVQQCQKNALIISNQYQIIRQVVQPNIEKDYINWKKILNVQNEADLRIRFLAAHGFLISPEDINRVTADFKYLFPPALPVKSQSDGVTDSAKIPLRFSANIKSKIL